MPQLYSKLYLNQTTFIPFFLLHIFGFTSPFSAMAIENYFQLTVYLVTKYVESIYPSSQEFKLIETTKEPKLNQSEIYYKDEKFLIVSITEISNVQSLINLLNLDGRLDNALINWEWFDLDEIKFPINNESDGLPKELVEKFNTKFRYIIDNEKLALFCSSK